MKTYDYAWDEDEPVVPAEPARRRGLLAVIVLLAVTAGAFTLDLALRPERPAAERPATGVEKLDVFAPAGGGLTVPAPGLPPDLGPPPAPVPPADDSPLV